LIAARAAAWLAERLPLPDALCRAAIARLVDRTAHSLSAEPGDASRRFAEAMVPLPIAHHADEANAQHYELPPEFFGLVLGPRRKYSCCLYEEGAGSLAEAETAALVATCANAGIGDGQRILELGCGWGSLTLWMACRYPSARITAVSNSRSQRDFILGKLAESGLRNVEVLTADMKDFAPAGQYDRVVSVEMFEHMSNWRPLLLRIHDWLEPGGQLFLHVFSHRRVPYSFAAEDKNDWIAQHYFTGGIMPSHDLIRQFADSFALTREWRWSGENYRRTALDWLANYDLNAVAIRSVLRRTYGDKSVLWQRRWRLFFLATAGLFGHARGVEWGVSHYSLTPVRTRAAGSGD
jgi:cyclopropane-fatty-acyl-phospholipid synthase